MPATLAFAAALLAGAAAIQTPTSKATKPIPAHPDQLTFKPIVYEPPKAAEHRVVLKNGMVVFIAEDRTLPLVNIALTVRSGKHLEPAGKEGVAELTGVMLRRGGTKSLSADELDEKLDFLAAQVSTGIGDASASANLNCLAENLDEALALFVEMLREPRFQEDRLRLSQEQTLQEMKKRNDDSADIESREWNVLLYGEDHFTNRFPTEASITSIDRGDLSAFHRRAFHPANMVAAVSGAFSREEMLGKLETAFAAWPFEQPVVPAVPSGIAPRTPGLYRIEKDVNQGRVSIGLPTVQREHPDAFALTVMNEILGGSGFTSRIMKTVRSNEGLAYSAFSSLSLGVDYPGRFQAAFQSKSRSVAYAAQLVLTEIRKIRETPVAAAELDTIKKGLVESFPGNFESRARSMAVFAGDEFTKRDPGYWSGYRDRIRAVSVEDVQRVAQAHLRPEKLLMLVVGNQQEIDLGDGQHDVGLAALAGGKVTVLPLRDPMTMKGLEK
ncbi:MAG TPA: pitrilysin family protein [Vicinamibacteria bacterium]|nr:pitrilysin family protein [Vicinamibacteria bacterium]